jgi:hypothetical protein
MTSCEEFGKNAVQQFDLSRCPDELVVDISTGADLILDTLEQERMLTDLAQLHKLVAQTLDASRFPASRILEMIKGI